LHVAQPKVFDKVQFVSPILAWEMFNDGNIPHQNRLCFFVTFFAQAKKVGRDFG